MRLASHNTFTYLQPRRWWMRPFAFMARCQRVSWTAQVFGGVRLFDLRVRFADKNGSPVICHGLMEYEGRVYDLLQAMNNSAYNLGEPFFVRVVLESKNPTERDIRLFEGFCAVITNLYPRLRFFGGNDRSDWSCAHPHYNFKTPLQDLDDKYSSTTTLFPKGLKWLRFLDDLCPVLYARLHNRANIKRGTTHDWLFIDFVDIQ